MLGMVGLGAFGALAICVYERWVEVLGHLDPGVGHSLLAR